MDSSLRTAAQQALTALEAIREADMAGSTPTMVIEARSMCEPTITALRAALANYDNELSEIDSDGARCGIYNLPRWCDIHQHYKWCEHNGGVMGPTGWEMP